MAKHFKTDATPQGQRSALQQSWQAPVQQPVITTRVNQTGNYVGRDARKAKPKRNVVATVLMVVGIVLLLVAGGMFGFAQWQYHVQDANNEKLASYAMVSDNTDTQDTGPVVDWAGLKAVNDDVVAWIQIPGTVVNYPVYKGSDNDEYLHTTAEGEYSIGGQIFMDYENASPGLVDRQTLIYGHHLYNGSMFTYVDSMTDQATFDSVSTIWYVTENETYELTPLFIYKTAATNNDARQITFESDDAFHTYLSGLLAQASAQSSNASEVVGTLSKVVTLATCDYNNDFGEGNGRCLLVCALKSEVSAATTEVVSE